MPNSLFGINLLAPLAEHQSSLQRRIAMRKFALAAVTFSTAVWLATSAFAASFSFSTGNPDGRLGALSRPPSAGELETETAADFILNDTTVITGATIWVLLPSDAPPADI